MNDPSDFISIGNAADSKSNAQWWLLFAVMVAGKNAEQTTKKLNQLLHYQENMEPFQRIAMIISLEKLDSFLRSIKVGQYTRIEKAFTEIIYHASLNLLRDLDHIYDDPRIWSVEELEAISGIGPKTARWFFMLCHPEAKIAALDTHVLKFLRDCGYDAPKSTPPAGNKYTELEDAFISKADMLGVLPRDLDFFVWSVYRNGGYLFFDRKQE